MLGHLWNRYNGKVLKSDYFRIEMAKVIIIKLKDFLLKSDYFRIEIT